MTDYEFAVTDPELDIDVKAASVVLDRGPVGTVTVQIETKNPEDWLVSQHGDSITVRDEQSGWRLRKGHSRVRITTPDGTAADISTASGDITVVVATGRTVVSTASGDVRVGRVTGDVSLKTASGDLVAAAVGGRLESSTASGDVRVEEVLGNARISTASGDIRIARFEGAEFAANTVSGDVSLGIPSGRAVDLDVKTLSGKVSLPERRTTPAASPTGPPASTVSIRVKSVSGDFQIQRA